MRVFLLLFALLAGVNASTFHVSADGNDKNAGTSAAPWRTIQRAMDDPAVGAGDLVLVGPGIYREALLVTRGGTWRNPLRLRGSPGTRIEAPTIRFSRCGPLVFEDFEIQGPQNAPAVVVTDVAPGVVLRGLTLHGGSVGIALENASGVLIERNRILEAGVGVLVEGRGNVLRNNLIENSGETGVALGGEGLSIDALVRNNSLIRNGRRPTSPGNLHLAWARGTRIENNIFVAAPGRRLFTFDGGQTTFSHNLYFSPNGADAAAFSWRDVPKTGFSGLRLVTADPAAMFADPMPGDSLPHPTSPAVDVGIGRPSAGERDLAGNLRRSGSAIDLGAWELKNPPGLRVSGNQLVHQNRVVRLRGVGVGDPLLDRRERPLSDYRLLRDRWNANTVRISVHPYIWREAEKFGGRAAVIDWLRHDIEAATAAGLYVILDWHITGWPDGYAKPSEPGEPEGLHDSSFALAEDFWNTAAAAFGSNGLVAFELWNEPVRGPDDWRPDPTAWDTLRPYLGRLTAIVRQHSENLVIVTGGSWAYGLTGIRENPPEDLNTAIAWHVYAGKEGNDETRWAAAFDDLDRDFPVIVTEWGYDENGKPHYRGGVADFGSKFARNWLEGRRLHWVAWCWHPTVGPSLLQKDWATPTAFGQFVLQGLRPNPRRPLEPPSSIDRTGRAVRDYRPFEIH